MFWSQVGVSTHSLPANSAAEVFIEQFHLSMVWWPPTGSVHRLSKLKKKKKTEVAWLGIFALKKINVES